MVREPGDMFDATEPLFFDRGDQLAIADEDRGDVAVIRVDAEDVHC